MNAICFSSFISAVLILMLPLRPALADLTVRELGRDNGEPEPYAVPYGFVSEAMGFVIGVAGGVSGLPQEQNSFVATALVSDNDAAAAYAFFNDYQFSNIERLFLDASISIGEFPRHRVYLDQVRGVGAAPAGSNRSLSTNFYETRSYTSWIELDFKYVLDIGHGKYTPNR